MKPGLCRGRALFKDREVLEDEARAKLELAGAVDGFADSSEGGSLLLYVSNAVHAGVSVLRRVAHVIARDIEAQCFGFRQLNRFIDGKVQVASTSCADLIKVSWGAPRNKGRRWQRKAVDVKPMAHCVGSA